MQQHSALADPLDAERREVVGPLVERSAECVRLRREVLVPARRVLQRIGAGQPQHPRVAATAVQPVVEPRVRIVLVVGDPADEQRRVTVLRERLGGVPDDALRELVRGQPAVAVLPPRLGGDDVGRVAGDQVERLAGHRLEEAARTRLDVVELVQRRVDRCERERALIDVGRDHVVAVLRRRAARGCRCRCRRRAHAPRGAGASATQATTPSAYTARRTEAGRRRRVRIRRTPSEAPPPVRAARGERAAARPSSETERQQRVDPVLRERFGRSREIDRQLQEEEASGDRER